MSLGPAQIFLETEKRLQQEIETKLTRKVCQL